MSDEATKFEHWAIVELFGQQQLAGKVTSEVVAGAGFLRIDVPRKDGRVVTKYANPKSVYALTPCTEEVATACAHRLEYGVEPVQPADWSRQLPSARDDFNADALRSIDDDEPIDEDIG